MMDVRDVLVAAYATSHTAVRETMQELPAEWLFWRPAEGLNHAGFLAWHLLRDEDVVVQGELLGREQIWMSDGWGSRLGLETGRQGTGFRIEESDAFSFGIEDLLAYAERVWEASELAMRAIEPADLEREIYGRSMTEHLLEGSIGHNWVHLGEIRAIMGLRGWRFRE